MVKKSLCPISEKQMAYAQRTMKSPKRDKGWNGKTDGYDWKHQGINRGR
jgi:hypothetical protein